MFFSLYIEVPLPTCPYYKLSTDGVMEQGSVSVTMKQTSQFKNTHKKNIFTFVLCQVRLILFNSNLITKKIFHLRKPF